LALPVEAEAEAVRDADVADVTDDVAVLVAVVTAGDSVDVADVPCAGDVAIVVVGLV